MDNIATMNDIPVDYVVLAVTYGFQIRGKNAFVDEFYRKKGFQGRRIGEKMITFVSSEAVKMEIADRDLESELHITAAIGMYRTFHFKDHKRILMIRMLNV